MASRKSSFARNFSKWRKSADRQRKSFVKSFSRTKKAAVKATKKAARKYGLRPKRPAKYGYKTVFRKGAAITRDTYVVHEDSGAPRLALIINAKRGKDGLPGLYGEEMRSEIDRVYKSRISAISFLGAGFLTAMAVFARKIGKPIGKNAQRWLSKSDRKSIGSGVAASNSVNPTAEFWNDAMSEISSNLSGAMAHKEAALRGAMEQESKRMAEYIARKQQERIDTICRRMVR